MKSIWDGKGDADGLVYFTKDNGTIVGRPYVRRRVVSALAHYCSYMSSADRAQILAETVDNDDWLRGRALSTVSAICRDAIMHLI